MPFLQLSARRKSRCINVVARNITNNNNININIISIVDLSYYNRLKTTKQTHNEPKSRTYLLYYTCLLLQNQNNYRTFTYKDGGLLFFAFFRGRVGDQWCMVYEQWFGRPGRCCGLSLFFPTPSQLKYTYAYITKYSLSNEFHINYKVVFKWHVRFLQYNIILIFFKYIFINYMPRSITR